MYLYLFLLGLLGKGENPVVARDFGLTGPVRNALGLLGLLQDGARRSRVALATRLHHGHH
jgi:hypothetical protein